MPKYKVESNPIYPDWMPRERFWVVKDDKGVVIAMFSSKILARAFAEGIPTAALWHIAITVCNVASDWVTDDGSCHFCTYDENAGKRHDADCPLRLFDEDYGPLLRGLETWAKKGRKS